MAYEQQGGTSIAPEKLTAAQEQEILTEVRERFDYAWTAWQPIRKESDIDMRHVAGDPWNGDDRRAREAAGRPCLALDELGQYFNQSINDILANPIGMKFDPTGRGASEKGAEFYADKAREIEYRSHAQIAYTTAYQNTIHRGFGWVRVSTKYENDRSDNQDICIDEISDPNTVVPDPDAKRPDSSDMRYLFLIESWDVKEFKRKWTEAKITDFSGTVAAIAPLWIKDTRVQVAEYWKVKTRKRKLVLFQGPGGDVRRVFEDEALQKVPAGYQRVKELRTVEYPSVCQYITNGVEILETNEWLGKYIPFASCFGPVLYLDKGAGTERVIMSMTRLARDPYMLYCYYRTQQAEMAGMIPKVPVMGYEGQFEGVEADWQKAPHEPLAFITVKAFPEGWPTGGAPAPLPQRLAYEAGAHLQSLELCSEGARRAIQSAMGSSPLPTQAQRHNEKSGVALKQMDSMAQKGSFHFVNHYQDMIRQVAVMVEDLMDKIYDTARDTGIRKPNETAQSVRINDPKAVDKDGAPAALMTEGDYLVTVSTGPSTDSTREAASDFADQLVQNPQVFPLIASEVVRLKNLGPIGDEMADALEVLKPPELRKQKDGSAPLPPQAQQAMAENAQLKQQLGQAMDAIKTDQAKSQAVIAKAQIDAKASLHLQMMKDATSIAVAKINAAAKGLVSDNEAQVEAIALDHAAEQAEIDRQHEAAMSVMQAQHSANAADQGHAQALEAGDAGHQQAIEQAQNQAALQPPQEAGA